MISNKDLVPAALQIDEKPGLAAIAIAAPEGNQSKIDGFEKFSFNLNKKNDLNYNKDEITNKEISSILLTKPLLEEKTKEANVTFSRNEDNNSIFNMTNNKNEDIFGFLKTLPNDKFEGINKLSSANELWHKKTNSILEEDKLKTQNNSNDIIGIEIEKKMSIRHVNEPFKNSYQKLNKDQNEQQELNSIKNQLNKNSISMWTNLSDQGEEMSMALKPVHKELNADNDQVKGGLFQSFNNFVSLLSQNASKYFCPTKSKDEIMSNTFEINKFKHNVITDTSKY